MTAYTTFRLVGERTSTTLRSSIEGLCSAWAASWFAAPPSGSVIDCRSEDIFSDAGPWRLVKSNAEQWLAIRIPVKSARAFASLLFNSSALQSSTPTPMVKTTLNACFDDLAARLLKTDEAKHVIAEECAAADLLNSRHVGYGSGTCLVRLGDGYPEMDIALAGDVVAGLTGSLYTRTPCGKVVGREAAIGAGVVSIEAILGHAELSVGELTGISVGDVIHLDTACQDTMLVQTQDCQPLFRANLGTRNDHKALLLVGKAN